MSILWLIGAIFAFVVQIVCGIFIHHLSCIRPEAYGKIRRFSEKKGEVADFFFDLFTSLREAPLSVLFAISIVSAGWPIVVLIVFLLLLGQILYKKSSSAIRNIIETIFPEEGEE